MNGHRLGMIGVSTPKPLAFIERCKLGLVWNSYLVNEYTEGEKLYDFLKDEDIPESKKSEVIGQITKLIDKMGEYNITHGDLKHSNILISESGPVLTDLDAMRQHKARWFTRIRKQTQLRDFRGRLKDWH